MKLVIIFLIIGLIDGMFYGSVPFNYREKFSPFWRKVIIGSGVFLWVTYKYLNNGKDRKN
jgi:hypothetical protein